MRAYQAYCLAAGGGLLLSLPYRDGPCWPVWVAPAAALLAVADASTAHRALARAALFALSWTVPAFWFITPWTWVGMLALAVYTSAFYVAALWVVWHLARRGCAAAVLGSAALWALVELARARVPVFQFAWLQLGHALSGSAVLRQAAEVLGVYGLSFLVAAVNASWAFVVAPCLWPAVQAPPGGERRRRSTAAAVALLFLAALLYGRWRMAELEPKLENGPFLALLQGCEYQKIERTDEEKAAQLKSHLLLHAEAARAAPSGERPALVCWAETMVPGAFNADPYAEVFLAAVKAHGVPTLFGSDYIHPDDLAAELPGQRWQNSAFLAGGDGTILARYAKRRLVPFGEYVPFKARLPFMQALSAITRDAYAPGDGPSPVVQLAGLTYAMNICIEDSFPDLAREAARDGAQVLLNVTNDGWFVGTPGAAAHLLAARWRAVEVRRPLVRVTNSGVSACVDPLGEVTVVVPPDSVGVGRVRLRLLPEALTQTPYMALGDGGVAFGLALVLLGTLWAARRRMGPH